MWATVTAASARTPNSDWHAPLPKHPAANYMVVPDAGWVPQACASGGFQSRPNDNDADWTLNVWSHEQMEIFTDPHGNAV